MTTDVAMLAEVPLFALMDEATRGVLLELCDKVRIPRGETIFAYGDPGDSLYVIRRGRVQIFVEDDFGGRIVLAEHGPGEIFGEISLLDGGARTAGAVAVETTDALMLDRADLLEFITKHPPAALDLLTVMGRRLRSTNELLRARAPGGVIQQEPDEARLRDRMADRAAGLLGSWGVLLLLGTALAAVAAVAALRGEGIAGWPVVGALPLGLMLLLVVQTTVLLMALGRQAERDRRRADLAEEFAAKMELDIARLHAKLDRLASAAPAHDTTPEPPAARALV